MSSWTTSAAQSLLIEWQILEKMAWAHITSREKEAQITEMTFPEAEVSNVAGIQLPRDYSSLSQYLLTISVFPEPRSNKLSYPNIILPILILCVCWPWLWKNISGPFLRGSRSFVFFLSSPGAHKCFYLFFFFFWPTEWLKKTGTHDLKKTKFLVYFEEV